MFWDVCKLLQTNSRKKLPMDGNVTKTCKSAGQCFIKRFAIFVRYTDKHNLKISQILFFIYSWQLMYWLTLQITETSIRIIPSKLFWRWSKNPWIICGAEEQIQNWWKLPLSGNFFFTSFFLVSVHSLQYTCEYFRVADAINVRGG